MGYLAYYLLWFGLAYASHYPGLAVGAVVVYLCRGFLPDPWVWLRTLGRIRSLRSDIAANPANVTARRDVARLYLERRRPRTALTFLDEARKRHPDDPELLYLTGLARYRAGDAEGALDPLVRAVDLRPGLLFGEPYLVAGDALLRLGRPAEAEDAFDRFVHANTSSVQGFVKLARARQKGGDADGARAALREALETWRQVPGFKRRRELGWWLEANLRRLVS
jgi:tetratricopeptide (TPR) repeat protein